MKEFIQSDFVPCEFDGDDNRIWHNLGPFDSNNDFNDDNGCFDDFARKQNQGRINGISVHPDSPNVILIGGAMGGIWKTRDAGNTWYNVTASNGLTIIGASKIERHPDDPQVVYASTDIWNGAWKRSQAYGIGLLVSIDGGETWNSLKS